MEAGDKLSKLKAQVVTFQKQLGVCCHDISIHPTLHRELSSIHSLVTEELEL